MKHNLSIVRKLKLDHYEIRVLVDALNAKRLKQKESGIDTTETSNLILYLLVIALTAIAENITLSWSETPTFRQALCRTSL